MSRNIHELAEIAAIVSETGANIWEVFFLVHVGRGESTDSITPTEHEEVCHFLVDASHYGFTIRTVEAPFFRRIVVERREQPDRKPVSGNYLVLSSQLRDLLGEGVERSSAHTAATRDGKGIIFVAHDGQVYPAGFLPMHLGSIRDLPLAKIYRENEVLLGIRSMNFGGKCGVCEFADLCGGSRARAYATSGDPLAQDPACAYIPVGRSDAVVAG